MINDKKNEVEVRIEFFSKGLMLGITAAVYLDKNEFIPTRYQRSQVDDHVAIGLDMWSAMERDESTEKISA